MVSSVECGKRYKYIRILWPTVRIQSNNSFIFSTKKEKSQIFLSISEAKYVSSLPVWAQMRGKFPKNLLLPPFQMAQLLLSSLKSFYVSSPHPSFLTPPALLTSYHNCHTFEEPPFCETVLVLCAHPIASSIRDLISVNVQLPSQHHTLYYSL